MKNYAFSSMICLAFLYTTQAMQYSAQEKLQSDEYAVYAALIKRIYVEDVPKEKRVDLLVIEEATSLQDRVAKDLDVALRGWSNQLRPLDEEMIGDLKAKNKQPLRLKPLFDIPLRYAIVSKEELTNSFGDSSNPADAWERFYQRYPNSAGLISLSRVGFNHGISKALVYLERACGPSCAEGRVVFLTKEKEHWAVQSVLGLWVI